MYSERIFQSGSNTTLSWLTGIFIIVHPMHRDIAKRSASILRLILSGSSKKTMAWLPRPTGINIVNKFL